jgi:hypothetical protein
MDFGKAFTFVFEDPEWIKKVLIAALFSLIPVIGTLVTVGWAMEAGQRVIRQDPLALPEVDFGKHLGLGFKAFLIGLVYAIPVLVILIPISVVSMMPADNDTTTTVMTIVSLCCGGLAFLYSLILMVAVPAAMSNFLATEQVGAAFRFSEIISLLRAAPGAFLMVLLGGIVTGFVASLGSIACGIGVLVTAAYAMVVNYHLIGQAYRTSIANGALIN